MPTSPTFRRVTSGDVSLAVREHSPAGEGRPTVVLVHGYPDSQDTWGPLVARLPVAEWHVVTYDVRGAGLSDAPQSRSSYVASRLVDDLVAVLDAVLPEGGSAHLVGHDWGSVQLWDAVAAEATHPRLRGRIASFTSVSGPSLDHVGWLVRHPQGREDALRRQRRRSWYIGFFCLPVVPTLVWRFGHRLLGRLVATREGLPRAHFGPGLGRDAVHGLELYRANVRQRVRRPGRLRTEVPVLVVRPTRDRFVTPVMTEGLDQACSSLRVVDVDAAHWVVATEPELVAGLLREHVEAH